MSSLRNVHGFQDLAGRFGPVVRDGALLTTADDVLGQAYRDVLAETTAIVIHQWTGAIRRSAVKGFFFTGPPGVGKTLLAWRIAYELAARFAAPPAGGADQTLPDEVVLVLIDGAEIARSRYGESEERIREVFARARAGVEREGQRAVLLFDDVESILMARGSPNAKEWHFSQDSVFFHAIDELDTSRAVVCLTSNRPDLVDEAILDRFLVYPIGVPDEETLVGVARKRAEEHSLDAKQIDDLLADVRGGVRSGAIRSVRQLERMVVQRYIASLTGGRPSRSVDPASA